MKVKTQFSKFNYHHTNFFSVKRQGKTVGNQQYNNVFLARNGIISLNLTRGDIVNHILHFAFVTSVYFL